VNPGHADTVLVGGNVFRDGGSWPGAGAVIRERIARGGTDDEVRATMGPRTDVVDLAGGLVLPGFQDAHAHPLAAGVDMLRCDLGSCRSADEVLARVRAYADANPDLPWILGSGWSMSDFPRGCPGREQLDAVVPDRPALLSNRDGHGMWANSRALDLAGIDAATPDPPDGRIEREPDGRPQGTLHEGAGAMVERLAPVPTAEDQLAGLLAAQEVMFSVGITAWQDAAVGALWGQPDSLPVYLGAQRSGQLRARVVGALWWDRDRGGEQVDDLVARRAEAADAGFRATAVKVMQDGVVENFTAGLLSSYLDACGAETGNRGLSFVDPVALREHVTTLDRLGFQVHLHTLGDRAVREALDAVEAARSANGPDHPLAGRHHLAHLQVVSPEDIPRFAALGVAANVQPLWAAHEAQMDDLTIPFLGDERSALQYPFADLVAAGAHLAAGSDWPVSSPDPLQGTHVAVNRVLPGATGAEAEPFHPRNRVDLGTMLMAYTAGSAWVNGLEASTGRLEPGYLADLAVLDRDPFAGPAEEIAAATVAATYLAGELVFASDRPR
jgi:predicted amidohydrolase YtcJ